VHERRSGEFILAFRANGIWASFSGDDIQDQANTYRGIIGVRMGVQRPTEDRQGTNTNIGPWPQDPSRCPPGKLRHTPLSRDFVVTAKNYPGGGVPAGVLTKQAQFRLELARPRKLCTFEGLPPDWPGQPAGQPRVVRSVVVWVVLTTDFFE